jgi:serine-type D-Ala-D-Ala carboxypeptidase (penicillin-binding protein 5/6)
VRERAPDAAILTKRRSTSLPLWVLGAGIVHGLCIAALIPMLITWPDSGGGQGGSSAVVELTAPAPVSTNPEAADPASVGARQGDAAGAPTPLSANPDQAPMAAPEWTSALPDAWQAGANLAPLPPISDAAALAAPGAAIEQAEDDVPAPEVGDAEPSPDMADADRTAPDTTDAEPSPELAEADRTAPDITDAEPSPEVAEDDAPAPETRDAVPSPHVTEADALTSETFSALPSPDVADADVSPLAPSLTVEASPRASGVSPDGTRLSNAAPAAEAVSRVDVGEPEPIQSEPRAAHAMAAADANSSATESTTPAGEARQPETPFGQDSAPKTEANAGAERDGNGPAAAKDETAQQGRAVVARGEPTPVRSARKGKVPARIAKLPIPKAPVAQAKPRPKPQARVAKRESRMPAASPAKKTVAHARRAPRMKTRVVVTRPRPFLSLFGRAQPAPAAAAAAASQVPR